MRQFERTSAFPNIIGAIDGTHIKIKAPQDDKQSYVNRKGYHSIHVQAVCTQNLLFTSVLAGNVGSVHDARVFWLSNVSRYIDNPQTYFPNNSHIVRDSAYGIHPHIMIPFKDNGHLTAEPDRKILIFVYLLQEWLLREHLDCGKDDGEAFLIAYL
ncbi:putative nuclease HARBI1 [Odontomachus brunneus]|uniref:putative nuclease HARBI1 n=1 Tax=Odontomachus brunneus TaxID=486640 RepID=UPI0013F22080|nr:putative nuclease HARBI1 [Odontomachus brunneus]